MLVLSRKAGERLVLSIGRYRATIEVLAASRGRVRIGVDAPAAIRVLREELCREAGAPRRLHETV